MEGLAGLRCQSELRWRASANSTYNGEVDTHRQRAFFSLSFFKKGRGTKVGAAKEIGKQGVLYLLGSHCLLASPGWVCSSVTAGERQEETR